MGLFTAIGLVIIGPTVWVDVLKNTEPLFPYKYPALFSMVVAFLGTWFFSLLDDSEAARQERAAFAAQDVRCQTGIGAEGVIKH